MQEDTGQQDRLPDEIGQAIAAYLEALKSGKCPVCHQLVMQEEQRGMCVYASPCGHRLFQGSVER